MTLLGSNANLMRILFRSTEFLSANEIAQLVAQKIPVFLPHGFDVLDIGASKGGGSIQFLTTAIKKHRLAKNDTRTLGIDIDPYKVKECLSKNHTCMEGNVLQLQALNDTTVSGTTMWHVLEHMPTCDVAKEIWLKSSSIATKFALFHGPVFDNEHVLRQAGFHRFYEDWTGHSCHFDSNMLIGAIESSPKTPTAYIVVLLKPITSSENNVILPHGAEIDSHHYDPSLHPPKPNVVEFSSPIYEEMRACAIFESLDELSLYSALAVDDVLGVMGRFSGVIVKCQL